MKHTRRNFVAALMGGAAIAGGTRIVVGNSDTQLPPYASEGSRSGPLGPSDAVQTLASERPVAMIIVDAEVDAEVEINHIVDGQMLDPTGAWVVAWYEGTGMLHEKKRNILFSGHVDYWGVGPAVFRNIANLPEGAQMQVLGEKGGEATYSVEYVERVTLAEMTAEKMQEITAPTPYEAMTIITCGGEFDYDAGEYLQRDIIRGRLIAGKEQGTEISDESSESTPEASAETSESTPEAETESADKTATVTQDGVNVRPDASTSQDPVAVLGSGDTVTITGDSVEGEGYTWYPIRTEDGTEGFVVADFLEIAD